MKRIAAHASGGKAKPPNKYWQYAKDPELSSTGCPLVAPLLEECLGVQWKHGFGPANIQRGEARYTHGFHRYPAGMNPGALPSRV